MSYLLNYFKTSRQARSRTTGMWSKKEFLMKMTSIHPRSTQHQKMTKRWNYILMIAKKFPLPKEKYLWLRTWKSTRWRVRHLPQRRTTLKKAVDPVWRLRHLWFPLEFLYEWMKPLVDHGEVEIDQLYETMRTVSCMSP